MVVIGLNGSKMTDYLQTIGKIVNFKFSDFANPL